MSLFAGQHKSPFTIKCTPYNLMLFWYEEQSKVLGWVLWFKLVKELLKGFKLSIVRLHFLLGNWKAESLLLSRHKIQVNPIEQNHLYQEESCGAVTRGPEPGLQRGLGNSPQHQDRKRLDPALWASTCHSNSYPSQVARQMFCVNRGLKT